MHILVTGASGMIGSSLAKRLLTDGYTITTVGRSRKKLINMFGSRVSTVTWNELDSIKQNPDIIVHLAGHNIGSCLWTKNNMEIAFESRIKTAEILTNWCQKREISPKVLSASGVTYYGFYDNCNTICDENSSAMINRKQFTQTLAIECENSFSGLEKNSLRFGAVLSKSGGMIPKITIPAKLGLGATLGSGTQPVSWISLDDACKAIICVIKQQISGPINITSPEIISQHEFYSAISKAFNMPLFLKVPETILKIAAGDFAEQFLLNGQAVMPKKLVEIGFEYQHETMNDWLRENY